MGSGSDENDNDIKEFQTTVANPNEGPQARFVHYTQIYERTITTAAQRQVFSTTNSGEVNTISTGIANTTYFNLGLDFMPMKALNLSLDGFYLQATETPDNVSDKLGWEVDFKGSYKITKNLTYFVEAGWFDAGNFYGDQMSELGLEKKSVTQIVHGLNLTF
jgi:predicted porin